MNYSSKTRRAIKAYGIEACIDAYYMYARGDGGAATIAIEGPAILKTTQQADAAINAGREIQERMTAALRII
jgi:hypothetical protein